MRPRCVVPFLLSLLVASPSALADEAQRKELARWLITHQIKGRIETWADVKPSSGIALRGSRIVYVKLDKWPENRTLTLPRLDNVVSKVYLLGRTRTKLKIQPEPRTWKIALPEIVPTGDRQVVVLETEARPQVSTTRKAVTPEADGTILLHARTATTHGQTLRFEPQPHKNTLGYWANPADWAQWRFEVKSAGNYAVHIFQGCGKGHGGSEVSIETRPIKTPTSPPPAPIQFKVEETGHFQNFVARTVGTIKIDAVGTYTLNVRPVKMAAGAVMDLRMVVLTRNPE